MRIASVADVKAKFSGYLNASEQGPIVVTKNGRPVAMQSDSGSVARRRVLPEMARNGRSLARTAAAAEPI